VWPRTHREGVDRDIAVDQRRLAVKAQSFDRHGRKEWHGKPVLELRVTPIDSDFISMAPDHLDTRHVDRAQIEEGILALLRLQLLPRCGDFFRECHESPYVRCHGTEDG